MSLKGAIQPSSNAIEELLETLKNSEIIDSYAV